MNYQVVIQTPPSRLRAPTPEARSARRCGMNQATVSLGRVNIPRYIHPPPPEGCVLVPSHKYPAPQACASGRLAEIRTHPGPHGQASRACALKETVTAHGDRALTGGRPRGLRRRHRPRHLLAFQILQLARSGTASEPMGGTTTSRVAPGAPSMASPGDLDLNRDLSRSGKRATPESAVNGTAPRAEKPPGPGRRTITPAEMLTILQTELQRRGINPPNWRVDSNRRPNCGHPPPPGRTTTS